MVVRMVMQLDLEGDSRSTLAIDPFGAALHLSSRIGGLGGPYAGDDPSYVFGTAPVRPALGRVVFTVRFHELSATCGTLLLQVTAVSAHPGTHPMPMKTMAVPLADLAAAGGMQTMEIYCRRNMHYAITGNIYDETDAAASGLTVTFDSQVEEDVGAQDHGDFLVDLALGDGDSEPIGSTGRLVALDPPSLVHPASQGWTNDQFSHPPFAEWMAVLRRPAEPTLANWVDAYTLQSLRRYGALRNGASGLGFGVMGQSLPALMASFGCQILATARHEDDLPDADPGLALEELLRPDLCPPSTFFDRVHFTTINLGALPEGLSGFDFVWSVGIADSCSTAAEFSQFVVGSMGCLKSGGTAVHLFRLAGGDAPQGLGGLFLARTDIERVALLLVSHGHEVAQLKFARGPHTAAPVPYGIVTRRR